MPTLLVLCVVTLVCGCTPHEVRCGGRLDAINARATSQGAGPHTAVKTSSGVP